MPRVHTVPVAASKADGSVVILHIVCDAAPTANEIAQGFENAGQPGCANFMLVDLAKLPSREHRAAWVIQDGAVVIDPARIKIKAAVAAQGEPRRIVFRGDVFAQPDGQKLGLAAGLAAAALAAQVLAGDLRWHGGASDFSWPDVDGEPVPMDAPTLVAFARAALLA